MSLTSNGTSCSRRYRAEELQPSAASALRLRYAVSDPAVTDAFLLFIGASGAQVRCAGSWAGSVDVSRLTALAGWGMWASRDAVRWLVGDAAGRASQRTQRDVVCGCLATELNGTVAQ